MCEALLTETASQLLSLLLPLATPSHSLTVMFKEWCALLLSLGSRCLSLSGHINLSVSNCTPRSLSLCRSLLISLSLSTATPLYLYLSLPLPSSPLNPFVVSFSVPQGLMILLQNLPTMHWGNEEVSVLLAEAYRLKFAFADAPNHYKR